MLDVEILALEMPFEQIGEAGIVLDQQQAALHHPSSLLARGEADHLGDADGMVADPLELLRREHEVGRRGDAARILGHERDQAVRDAGAVAIDRIVHRGDPRRGGGVATRRRRRARP